MTKSPAIIAIILLTSILCGRREEYCYEKTVCMIMEQKVSVVKIVFQNKLPMAGQITTVTFEVKPKFENLGGADTFPLTRVVR